MNDTKLYVTIVTLSTGNNQKLRKLLSKKLERSVYWNKYKTEDKNTTSKYGYRYRYYHAGVNRLFVLVFQNQDSDSKRLKAKSCYLPKEVIDNYNVITNEKKRS